MEKRKCFKCLKEINPNVCVYSSNFSQYFHRRCHRLAWKEHIKQCRKTNPNKILWVK